MSSGLMQAVAKVGRDRASCTGRAAGCRDERYSDAMSRVNLPAIVLVHPRRAGNVGAAARAMANMGLNELVLVEPAVVIGDTARAFAVGAGRVLDGTRRAESIESPGALPARRRHHLLAHVERPRLVAPRELPEHCPPTRQGPHRPRLRPRSERPHPRRARPSQSAITCPARPSSDATWRRRSRLAYELHLARLASVDPPSAAMPARLRPGRSMDSSSTRTRSSAGPDSIATRPSTACSTSCALWRRAALYRRTKLAVSAASAADSVISSVIDARRPEMNVPLPLAPPSPRACALPRSSASYARRRTTKPSARRRALLAGGVELVEITFTVPEATHLVRKLLHVSGGDGAPWIGMGTSSPPRARKMPSTPARAS